MSNDKNNTKPVLNTLSTNSNQSDEKPQSIQKNISTGPEKIVLLERGKPIEIMAKKAADSKTDDE